MRSVRSFEDEGRRAKPTEDAARGACTRWGLPKRSITGAAPQRLEPFGISFLLREAYDTLTSPVNPHRRRVRSLSASFVETEEPEAHILSGCKLASVHGRYRWLHDRALTT